MSLDPKQKLQTDFPSLVIESIKKIGEGWDNDAYLVNEKTVFRIQKTSSSHLADEQQQHIKVEIEILNKIVGRLSARTPTISHVAPDNSYLWV
jgi:hypothetical protein